MREHAAIMDSFMPLYYLYFHAVANYTDIFAQQPAIAEILAHLEQVKV